MTIYTIKGKSDGFGAQYQAIMSGIAFCCYKKYNYFHTKFTRIEHDVNVNKLNEFIGITNNDVSYNESEVTFVEPYSAEVHRSQNPSVYYTDEVIQKIRFFYYSTKKPEIDDIDIAIHIRRGDVNKNTYMRYTPNDFYIELINIFKKTYPTYKITIFSEGQIEDFKDLNLESENFKLNEEITKTFHSLVSAKVLVISKSSFSYSAAILNQNIIYYQKFWCAPLDKWTNIELLINMV